MLPPSNMSPGDFQILPSMPEGVDADAMLRIAALQCAVEVSADGADPQRVLSRADAFLAWLKKCER